MNYELIHELFIYRGTDLWRRQHWRTGLYLDEPEGHITDGYRVILLQGSVYPADRLVWLYVTGELPDGEIHHVNGDLLDNRRENLIDATGICALTYARKWNDKRTQAHAKEVKS